MKNTEILQKVIDDLNNDIYSFASLNKKPNSCLLDFMKSNPPVSIRTLENTTEVFLISTKIWDIWNAKEEIENVNDEDQINYLKKQLQNQIKKALQKILYSYESLTEFIKTK